LIVGRGQAFTIILVRADILFQPVNRPVACGQSAQVVYGAIGIVPVLALQREYTVLELSVLGS
jgi:hypothetical protein